MPSEDQPGCRGLVNIAQVILQKLVLNGANSEVVFCAHDEEMNTAVVHTVPAVDRYIHVLMREEKEGRKKQARSNKQQSKATQHTQGS